MSNNVHVWEENVTIPTYKVYPPEKGPLFIENRAYQGSSGKVYPLPVTEKISDKKEDVSYHAIYLENDYLKVMVLPELGGRIQRAYDKTNGYDFVYYNHVIKPALVGLTGPWISGGIEFNWPQHHRPSTYSPVDYYYQEREDGSATVYVSEIDKMYGTKGMGAFTLYPDKAYIEIKGQLFNNTDIPQTFLWWANPAVPVNDNTYSVFPPDVHAVMDHGKRAVSTFPIATGEYYKYDYSAGVDISMYKNIKVPTSYMAAHSDFDFIGNYDEGRKAGLLHVADHHISPGKKQWTWGNADFGRTWDRNLTDEDGPYIELMTGVFADNQPDFTWLKPYEEKTFTQYFMPYKNVGRVKNATKDAMVNFTIEDSTATLLLYTSGSYNGLTLSVEKEGNVLYSKTIDISPLQAFEDTFTTDTSSTAGCTVKVTATDGHTLVTYTGLEEKLEPIPDPAVPLGTPAELKSTEELFLGAQHLEQYRHATYEPADYYEEGLRRDPSDIRLNNGYGMLLMKRGDFAAAKKHFEAAIEKQTWKNPNPYNGECYFNLGLAEYFLGNESAAYDAFYKSTWSHETQSAGFYWLALLACKKHEYEQALTFAEQSMIRNWHNMKVRALKASILRKLGRCNKDFLTESLAIDPLSLDCLYEKSVSEDDLSGWISTMRTSAHNYLEVALDYIKAGLYEDVVRILDATPDKSPMTWYYMGYAYEKDGKNEAALDAYQKAEHTNPDYCFPNKIEEILILNVAISALKKVPYAHYYLGCLLYDKKHYDKAVNEWKESISENPKYAMAYRNLAIAYYNKCKEPAKALDYMKQAFELDSSYPRFLLEYDQLAAKNNVALEDRLALLEKYPELVEDRDVLYLEYITLLNETDQYDKALDALKGHTFHPWEGGEGKVPGQYQFARVELAKKALEAGNYSEAVSLLAECLEYPHHLGEGKLHGAQENDFYYFMGCAYEGLGQNDKAVECWEQAIVGPTEPAAAMYYNDAKPDKIFYQGLALLKLNRMDEANGRFHKLTTYGEKHLFDKVKMDYFAVSLPDLLIWEDDLTIRNVIHCKYMMALGYWGLNEKEKSVRLLSEVERLDINHQGIQAFRSLIG